MKRKNYFPKKSYSFNLHNGKTCTLEISCGLNKTYFNLILSKGKAEISRMLLEKEEFFAFIECYHDSRVDFSEVKEDDS